jgi:hypothetical protein
MTGFCCEAENLFRFHAKISPLGEQLSVLSQNIIVQKKKYGFMKIKSGKPLLDDRSHSQF